MLFVVSTNAANNFLDYVDDEDQNATAIDSLVNEDSFINAEPTMESNPDENLLDSTQPTNVSGENEPAVNVEVPCHQIEVFIGDVDAENSIGPDEHSYAREQSANNSYELVDSFHVQTFEPNENSTPKSTNEANENSQQTFKKEHEKMTVGKAVQKRAVSGYFISNSKASKPNTRCTFMFLFAAKST